MNEPKLTEEDIKFLSALRSDGSPTGSWLLPSATRANDIARNSAKKHGWATFDRKAWAWRITDAGLSVFSKAKGPTT